MGGVSGVASFLSEFYNLVIGSLPPFARNFVNLFLLVLLVSVYAIFIWKFHKFISRKNIINLNLNQYNTAEHPFLAKLVASAFYFLEYIIILPFLIFFWFAVFTFFMIFIAEENMSLNAILIISAIVVASIRMTSYYDENLSREFAKLLPFTLLAVLFLEYKTINIESAFQKIGEIPVFIQNIAIYLLFIIILEIILRFFDFIASLFGLEDENEGS